MEIVAGTRLSQLAVTPSDFMNFSQAATVYIVVVQSQSQSCITTDTQSAGLSWCQAPIWDPRPIFISH
jgi:hypothetical protein